MAANVTAIMNGTQPSSCFNPTAKRIGETFVCCLLFVVSLAGNTIIGIIVYKTKTMRKPINFFIVNMAMSDLLFPIFLYPVIVTDLYVGSWLISGPLGEALCKLSTFFGNVSGNVSIQSLVLIAMDRFGVVLFPLRSPLISSKLCPFYILATWIIAMAFQCPQLIVTKLVEYPQGLACVWQWNELFGDYSSFENYTVAMFVAFCYTPLVLIAILYLTIALKIKSQKIRRRAISQRKRTTFEKGAKCTEDVHCYRVSVRSMLAATQYLLVSKNIFIRQRRDFVLSL